VGERRRESAEKIAGVKLRVRGVASQGEERDSLTGFELLYGL
jgi:hypothetical protein